jgi:hypothetical protein
MRLAFGASALTLALALFARSANIERSATPLADGSGRLFWMLVIVAATGFGLVVQRIWKHSGIEAYARRAARAKVDSHLPSAGALPAMSMVSALQLVAWDPRIAVILASTLLAGAGVFSAVAVRYYLFAGDPTESSGARLAHATLTICVGLVSMSIIYRQMADGFYTALAVGAVAVILLAQAFDGVRVQPVRRVAYAVAGSIILAEAAWALTFWPPAGWLGGLMMTTGVVVVFLTIEAIFSRRVDSGTIVRYVSAGVVAAVTLGWLAR